MQTMASVARSLFRIVFRGGSPQRIQSSPRLMAGALLALAVLAAASQWLVFRADLIDVSLYLFTLMAGSYLGAAWLSRRAPPGRLRQSLQAAALILAAGHLLLLCAAPFAASQPWLPYATAAAATALVLSGLSNCVQFAQGSRSGNRGREAAPAGDGRWAAVRVALIFAFALAAFYATMHWFLSIALA